MISLLSRRTTMKFNRFDAVLLKSMGQLKRCINVGPCVQLTYQKYTQPRIAEQQQQHQQQQKNQQQHHENNQLESQMNSATATSSLSLPPSSSSVFSSYTKDSCQQQQMQLKHLQHKPQQTSTTNAATSTPTTATPEPQVIIPYKIDWIFEGLKNPSGLWYICSQLAIFCVGLFSKFVLGVLPVRYVCNTFKIRWSMAAHDICFTNKYHSLFFMLGKCIPVIRGVGVYQDAVNLCIQKARLGHWVHVFPEGKVNMTKEEMRLKWGVGRIIYESTRVPIIIPMWHEGMDEVLPNVEPYIIKWGKKVTLNVGKPIDMNEFIDDLKCRGVPEPEARKLITDKIQDVFHKLRLETEELHKKRD